MNKINRQIILVTCLRKCVSSTIGTALNTSNVWYLRGFIPTIGLGSLKREHKIPILSPVISRERPTCACCYTRRHSDAFSRDKIHRGHKIFVYVLTALVQRGRTMALHKRTRKNKIKNNFRPSVQIIARIYTYRSKAK